MLFSNFVATIRADLDAIKDDLGEFVSTVKTDTTNMLGLAGSGQEGSGGSAGASGTKTVHWEEELWNTPELLCEDPSSEDEEWQKFSTVFTSRDDEAESLLASSEVVPELYAELVPARATHADFFKRLFFHRERIIKTMRNKVQELMMNEDEEEMRWEDDEDESEENPVPDARPSPDPVTDGNVPSQDLRGELELYKAAMTKLQAKVDELEHALKESEAKRTELEARLAQSAAELPHSKKPMPASKIKVPAEDDQDEEVNAGPTTSNPVVNPGTPVMAPKITIAQPSPSWEALPTSPASSSNEEPVVVGLSRTDEEEDDWE